MLFCFKSLNTEFRKLTIKNIKAQLPFLFLFFPFGPFVSVSLVFMVKRQLDILHGYLHELEMN